MRSFKDYSATLNENNPQTNQVLEQGMQSFYKILQQQFQQDPQGALGWLGNLYTKVLPSYYKRLQQTQQQPQQNQNQQQQTQQPQVQQ